ncbi:unnamed protein product, partial [marine sediment metagenome]
VNGVRHKLYIFDSCVEFIQFKDYGNDRPKY